MDARKRSKRRELVLRWTMFKVLREQVAGVRADARTGGRNRCHGCELWSKRHLVITEIAYRILI